MKRLPSIVKYALIIAIAATAFMAVGYAGTVLFNIHNTGQGGRYSAQAYSDQACTQALSTIDWGLPETGVKYDRVFYAKNIGDYPIRLVLSITGWSPSEAESYTTVSWDYGGETLAPGQAKAVTLSLIVSQSAPFSFDVAAGYEKP
jgi:hypothetical protein